MTKNNKLIISAFSILTISAIAFTTISSANAYQGDYTKTGPYHTEEREIEMNNAFNNNDYNAWKTLMNGRGRVSEIINEENFSKFAEAHKLANEGKYEEADKIREELGLRTRNSLGQENGHRYGQRHGFRK